jgi:hypothetical protein
MSEIVSTSEILRIMLTAIYRASGIKAANGTGCGTVFELTKARVERVLYSFDTANAGAPYGVILKTVPKPAPPF